MLIAAREKSALPSVLALEQLEQIYTPILLERERKLQAGAIWLTVSQTQISRRNKLASVVTASDYYELLLTCQLNLDEAGLKAKKRLIFLGRHSYNRPKGTIQGMNTTFF